MCKFKKILALILTFALILPCIPAISLTAFALEGVESAADASDYALSLQGFKKADLADYKAALALLESTSYTQAYTRLSTAITKLETEGYSYYDDYAAFGTFTSGMDKTDLQPGDAFASTGNTTGYDYLMGIENLPRFMALQDTASGKKAGENITAFSVEIKPVQNGSLPAVFFDYRDAQNWSAIVPNKSASQLHFITCTDGTVNYPAVLTANARWEPYRSPSHTLINTYYGWGSSYSSYYSSDDYSLVGSYTLDFVWNEDHYEVQLIAADGKAMPLFTGGTKLALNESKIGRAPQMLSNIVISNIAMSPGAARPTAVISVAAKYEDYHTHDYSKHDVTTAEKKYDANCQNPAEYYAQCSICDATSKGDTDVTFFDPNGTLGACSYEPMSDAFVHWEQCPGCGTVDPENPKTPHSGEPCSCGITMTAESSAIGALAAQGFYGDALAGYQAGLALLEDKKADETAINGTTEYTWKQAYDRLAAAIAKLTGGMTYYDDFKVFGQFKSDMDDRELTAGDAFAAEINTTNYNYIFGGAYAQRLETATTYTTVAGTKPWAVDLTAFRIASFHFHEWNSSIVTANNKDWTDYIDQNYSGINLTSGLAEEFRLTEKFNRVALNAAKVGAGAEESLEKFSVTMKPNTGSIVIYNYVDARNWSGIITAHARGFQLINCVDGKINNINGLAYNVHATGPANCLWHTYVYRSSIEGMNNNTGTDTNGISSAWSIVGNIVLNFTWNKTEKCYTLEMVHEDSGITVRTVNLNSTLNGGLTPNRMSTVMVADIKNNNSTMDGAYTSGHGIIAISAKFAEGEHVCVPTGEWIHNTTTGNSHYKLCEKCGEKAVEELCSGTTVQAVDGSNHKLVCADCNTAFGGSILCSAQGDIQHTGGQHWYDCVCGNDVGMEACQAAADAYEKSATEHWQICADCGDEITGSRIGHTYAPDTATYEKGNLCVCGADDGNKKTVDFLPVILGSKILVKTTDDQKLRIDVDFTDVSKFTGTIAEYGVIVDTLDKVLTDDTTDAADTVDKSKLIALYGTKALKIESSVLPAADDSGRNILKVNITIPKDQYGKRIALISYIKDSEGNFYYSTGNNANVGLTDGVINTGVMRVMKAVLKDANEATGYFQYIDDAAISFKNNEAHWTEAGLASAYPDASDIETLVKNYANGTIAVNSNDPVYVAAKTAARYVYYHCDGYYKAAQAK